MASSNSPGEGKTGGPGNGLTETSDVGSFPMCDNSHISDLLKGLNSSRNEKTLTDMALVARGGQLIHCHKVVLAAGSNYFRAMFTSGLQETSVNRVDMTSIDFAILECIVHFIYTSEVKITEENAQQLLHACDFLLLDKAKRVCEEFLIQRAQPHNSIAFNRLSNLYALDTLQNKAKDIMMSRFADVVDGPEFLTMSEHELSEYLGSDSLHPPTEDSVLESVVRWIRHDATQRSQSLVVLLENVRFPCCSSSYLCDLLREAEFAMNEECRTILLNALAYLNTDQRSPVPRAFTKPRNCAGRQFVVVCGGVKTEINHSLQNFKWWCISAETKPGEDGDGFSSVGRNQNVERIQSPGPQACYKACVVPEGILVTGGRMDRQSSDECWLFGFVTRKWLVLPNLHCARQYHGLVVLGRQPYIVGGMDSEENSTNILEHLDTGSHQWEKDAAMPVALMHTITVAYRACIYVIGGLKRLGEQHAVSNQVYEQKWNKWTLKTDMPNACEFGDGVAFQDRIYIVGGFERNCMSYSPATDQWNILNSSLVQHVRGAAMVLRGKIVVAGGKIKPDDAAGAVNQEEHRTKLIEEYDPRTGAWTMWDISLPCELSSHCMLLVRLPKPITT